MFRSFDHHQGVFLVPC